MERRIVPPCLRANSRGLKPAAARPTAKTTIAVKIMAGIRDFTGRSFYRLRSIIFRFVATTKVTKVSLLHEGHEEGQAHAASLEIARCSRCRRTRGHTRRSYRGSLRQSAEREGGRHSAPSAFEPPRNGDGWRRAPTHRAAGRRLSDGCEAHGQRH